MKTQQEDFKSTIENLERTIMNFHQHQNMQDHENIAKDVVSVNEQLIKYQDEAKKYNNQVFKFFESIFCLFFFNTKNVNQQ